MTVTAAPDPHLVAPKKEPIARRVTSTPALIVARWVLLAGLTVFAYWDTLASVWTELVEQTMLTYLPAAVVLCLIAAIGTSLRDKDEPRIYDRDTDIIVGTVIGILALSFQRLLNQRYLPAYMVTHVDLLSLLAFVLAGCILLFGLRPAARYRWVWLLSLSLFPLPYRIVVVSVGHSRLAAGAVMLLLGIAATTIAVGVTRRRALIGAGSATVLGAVLLTLLAVFAPTANTAVYQWVPAVGCAVIVGVAMYITRRHRTGSLRPFPHRRLRAPTAPRVPWAAALVTLAAIALHLTGAPHVQRDDGVTIAGLRTTPPMAIPAGWHPLEATGLLPSNLHGWNAVRMRQIIEQDNGEARFDLQSRPRRVVVDTIETSRPLSLDVYLPALLYDISGTRVSPARPVTLPHGVTGVLDTIVDDQRLLTYNRLTWRWNNGTWTQQVTLLSVDNHEPTATFPEFRRKRDSWEVINGMATLLFRGNAVTEDLTPQFKDRDLLTECAAGLIGAQLARSGVRDG